MVEIMNITVAANYHFSDDEILDIVDTIPKKYLTEAHRAEEFQANEILPLIQIVFYPIIEGLFQELGKDLWVLFRAKIINAINSKKSEIDVEFSFKNEHQELNYKIRTDDPRIFEYSFDKLSKIIENEQNKNISIQEFVFNKISKKWEEI